MVAAMYASAAGYATFTPAAIRARYAGMTEDTGPIAHFYTFGGSRDILKVATDNGQRLYFSRLFGLRK